MRVYIPATLAMLQQLVEVGSMQPLSGTAFAVTPTLRESYAEGDDEELAEVAIGEAALASLRLLAAEPGESGLPLRRAVLVADAPDADVTPRPDLDDAVVRINGRVALSQVVAAYVDNAAAEAAVKRRSRWSTRRIWATRTPSSPSVTPRTTTWPGMPPRSCRSCWICSEGLDTEP